MRHTFKASFEQQGDAQHLMETLAAAGYTRAELALSGATHAVTLVVESDADVKHAAEIIERAGPARLQEFLDEDAANAGASGSARMPAYPPGTEPGALQFHHLDSGRLFGTQDAEAPPAGMTFQESMGTAPRWRGADGYPIEPDGATPWPDTAPGDNDDARAAYQFGKAMRMDDRYRNRSWDDAEPDLKIAWAASSPDGFAWDSVKASVRSGWDWTTPDIDDDSYYRSHWTTSYDSRSRALAGDDASPVYMDSSEARRSERYRSHHASEDDDDPGEARTGRDDAHPSVWSRLEDAVHHGWDRMSATMPHADTGMSAWHKVKEAVRHGWSRGRH